MCSALPLVSFRLFNLVVFDDLIIVQRALKFESVISYPFNSSYSREFKYLLLPMEFISLEDISE